MKDKINKRVLVVASGGMDSTVALAKAVNDYEYVEVVSFKYGSNHNDREYAALEKTCAKYGVKLTRIDLDFIHKYFKSSLLEGADSIPEGHYAEDNMKSTVVPYRNGIMLSIAAGLAESRDLDAIILGNHSGDHTVYPDCRPSFITSISTAIKEGTWKKIETISPFCNMTKADIARLGGELGVDFSLTYSCYKGGEKHCGKCGTCIERKEAFELAGINDPTEYEV